LRNTSLRRNNLLTGRDTINEKRLSLIGWLLIISGSGLGIIGGVVNAIAYHDLAIDIWFFSNFFLLFWAIGFIKGWWNKKISVEAIAVMYLVFSICNAYAIVIRGH
jgi:hypothetical protein